MTKAQSETLTAALRQQLHEDQILKFQKSILLMELLNGAREEKSKHLG